MEISNWYQTPNQIEFSTYYSIDMTSGDTIAGIMGNPQMQMDLKENGSNVFSISVNE